MSEEPIEHEVVRGPHKNLATGLVKAVRPRQWVKNLLVLAAPLAAGAVDEPDVLWRTGVAFVAFCLIASCIYLVNDALDVEADRNHPTKRFRPIAAGVVPRSLAFVLAAVLGITSLGISFLANWQLAVVIAVYLAIQLGYCFGLKHEPVIDICIVSSGFLLRAIAGGVAAGSRRFDVLVSTTIIETGLDVSNANTMIINRADRYGLAQLYQLRGRVGRSDKHAFAYLLVPPQDSLSPIARKRLAAIR